MVRANELVCQGILPFSPKNTELNIILGGSSVQSESSD